MASNQRQEECEKIKNTQNQREVEWEAGAWATTEGDEAYAYVQGFQ